jgi:hypothetical protein
VKNCGFELNAAHPHLIIKATLHSLRRRFVIVITNYECKDNLEVP